MLLPRRRYTPSLHHLLPLLLLLLPTTSALSPFSLLFARDGPSPPPDPDPDEPCTVTSPYTNNFFDLRPLALLNTSTSTFLASSSDKHPLDYTALGQDYPSNFSLNICAPALSPLARQAVGLDSEVERGNVSAFYTLPKKNSKRKSDDDDDDDEEQEKEVFSIGSVSTKLFFRGRKLVLEYHDGSPCPSDPASSSSFVSRSPSTQYRKSTLLTFLCDQTLSPSTPATITYIGSLSHCFYLFEVRSPHACPTFKESGAVLGPFAIFLIILAIFGVVYCVGGCVYQRTVLNARGWRQVPHWAVWKRWLGKIGRLGRAMESTFGGVGGGGRRGYTRIGGAGRGGAGAGAGGAGAGGVGARAGGGGVGEDTDDENRLLDQLDEEWGDEL